MLFQMGLFSDTKHTHLGIFILESPPPPPPGWCSSQPLLFQMWRVANKSMEEVVVAVVGRDLKLLGFIVEDDL